jgi:UDP:flavonoid glycosyltransferase YjiC (YdhE family)
LANVDKFSFLKLYQNSQFSMVDAITRLAFPQSEVREVIQAGAHCNKAPSPEDLPEDYRQFVEDPNSEGTVYASFGTLIRWDFAPSEAVNAIFDAFERLPQFRFIFSFNGEMPVQRKFPPHIRIVNWAPQLALLHHPKTKVFFTHGGLKR